ncbi:MAG: 23S rRNA (adenine(2503)-C(2))-methyltransferase RlmN, partial [Cyanobacteriota bacterium]
MPPLLGRGLADLEAWAVAEGQPSFRGRQIHEWIYRRGVHDLAAITVLPQAWRTSLQEREKTEGQPLIGRLVEQHRR